MCLKEREMAMMLEYGNMNGEKEEEGKQEYVEGRRKTRLANGICEGRPERV